MALRETVRGFWGSFGVLVLWREGWGLFVVGGILGFLLLKLSLALLPPASALGSQRDQGLNLLIENLILKGQENFQAGLQPLPAKTKLSISAAVALKLLQLQAGSPRAFSCFHPAALP